MNPSSFAVKVRRKLADRMAASAIAAVKDRSVLRRSAGVTTLTGPHLLVASAGDGNCGDQAMLESFLEGTTGDVVVVTRGEDDFHRMTQTSERVVQFLAFPELVYGTGSARNRELRRFAKLLSTASSLSIIGADIMDGRYSLRGSVRRATLAEAAAKASIPTRIIGFSWSAVPRPRARAAIRRAARAGALPLLRDPVSAGRARANGIVGVRETADIVFTTKSVDPRVAEQLAPFGPRPLALVNVSALVGRGIDQVTEYRVIVEHLLDHGFRVILLPHVARATSNDILECAAVFNAVRDSRGDDATERLILIDRLLAPAAIRGLTVRASVTVTGRMHLAIMSLWSGVPAVTMSTQGKVEGLMTMFGVPQLCVEPHNGMAEEVISLLDEIRNHPAITADVRKALPEVIAIAWENLTQPPWSAQLPRQSATAAPG